MLSKDYMSEEYGGPFVSKFEASIYRFGCGEF